MDDHDLLITINAKTEDTANETGLIRQRLDGIERRIRWIERVLYSTGAITITSAGAFSVAKAFCG